MKRIMLMVALALAGSTYREAVRIMRPSVTRIRTREVLQ